MFLRAAGRLARGGEVNMNVCGAMLDGILQLLMTLQALMHIPRLSDVKRNPLPVLGLFAINVISRQGRKLGVQLIHRVLILGSRVPRPIDEERRRGFLRLATAQ